ncbi:MAG: hypothetical protein H7Y38_01050 [Armatimonadetes bacterium]|nr:hypothetical protein [Armatimonadota bacterium]
MFADSPAEVAADRADYEATYLTQLATVLRRDVTQGADGSHATDYKPMPGAPLPCRVVSSGSEREVEQGGQIVSLRNTEVRLPVGSDVRDTDRLQVGGETFAVIGLDAGRADALFIAATCTTVAGGGNGL